ncbi:ABC transporter substrate-binding protein [Cohnella silvisoli]|uniref:Extracellular solute-binding protein n=1 Tax=Cohnella silvisoli TaxID=2873699 RepID=A0ABV1KT44_9BACL|nr:extracellular solute-binding protein [Cohnella silvisoli]
MSLLSLILVLAVALSACGGKNNNGNAASPSASPSESSAAPSESSAPSDSPSAADDNAEVTFVFYNTEDEIKALRDNTDPGANKTPLVIYDQLKKNYPNYKINYQNWGWAEDLDSKQRAAILSGNVPDIVRGETFIPAYASEGILEPLPDDIVQMVNPNYLIKDNDGKPVAVAAEGTIFLLFYNKELLRKSGIDPETVKLDTWDDWKKVSDAITAAGKGKFFGGGVPSHPHFGGSLRFTSIVRSIGQDFGGGDKVTIDTPANIQALQFLRDMDKNLPKGVGNNPDEGPICCTLFEKEKSLAFVINGTWAARGAIANGIDLGIAPLPVGPNGKPSNTRVGFVYSAVPKASKNKEAAFNVLRTMLSKEVQSIMASQYSVAVANQEVQNDAANVYKDYPWMQEIMKLLQTNEFQPLPVFNKNNAQIWDIINSKVIARTTISNDPIDKIVKEAQVEADSALK